MPGNRKESVNYMEYNTKSAAEDLLARMMIYNKTEISEKYIMDNMDKFRSAIIIQSLIKNDMIIGQASQKVYEVYHVIAQEMDIDPLSKIDFSRTLCKYYAFESTTIRTKGELKKIFTSCEKGAKESAEIMKVKTQVHYISNVISVDDIFGHQSSEVYDNYLTWCKENAGSIGNKINFSRVICSTYNIQVKVKRKGKSSIKVYEAMEGDVKKIEL